MFMRVTRQCGHKEYLNLPVDADFIRIETEQKCSSCFFSSINQEPPALPEEYDLPELGDWSGAEQEIPLIPLGLHISAYFRFRFEQLKVLIFP